MFEVFYNICTSPNLFLSNKESSYALVIYIKTIWHGKTIAFYFSTEWTKHLHVFF